MHRSLGVDLAAQNTKTAVCVVEWHSGRAAALPPVLGGHGDNLDWIVDLANGADSIGIDAPFGWPAAVVDALQRWAAGERWPDVDKDDLRFRLTDQHVWKATSRPPLSVSSDRIAVAAWRCARLLDGLRRNERAVDRLGADDIFKVYPGAALTGWGFTRAGYKTSGNAESKKAQRAARVALLAEIEARARWLDLSDANAACEDNDDALDALIASFVARAASRRLTVEPTPREATRAAIEGWIHIPRDPDTFDRLAADVAL